DLRSPGGSRSRPGRAASSTTQVSMGNEWMFPIYQRHEQQGEPGASATGSVFASRSQTLFGNRFLRNSVSRVVWPGAGRAKRSFAEIRSQTEFGNEGVTARRAEASTTGAVCSGRSRFRLATEL